MFTLKNKTHIHHCLHCNIDFNLLEIINVSYYAIDDNNRIITNTPKQKHPQTKTPPNKNTPKQKHPQTKTPPNKNIPKQKHPKQKHPQTKTSPNKNTPWTKISREHLSFKIAPLGTPDILCKNTVVYNLQ